MTKNIDFGKENVIISESEEEIDFNSLYESGSLNQNKNKENLDEISKNIGFPNILLELTNDPDNRNIEENSKFDLKLLAIFKNIKITESEDSFYSKTIRLTYFADLDSLIKISSILFEKPLFLIKIESFKDGTSFLNLENIRFRVKSLKFGSVKENNMVFCKMTLVNR